MPLLPLPPGGTALSGGALPVRDADDVLAELPRPQRNASSAPVRDAICESFSRAYLAYQNAAAYVAAQADPLRATGVHLRAIADARKVPVLRTDDDETLRARIFATPNIVTPESIETAINAILAPRTTSVCRVSELNLDGWFVNNGTAVWNSFVGADPEYPDRYYDELPTTQPGGAVPSSGVPRQFSIRIPFVGSSDNLFTYLSSNPSHCLYAGDNSDTAGSESSGAIGFFMYSDPKTSDDIYAAIVAVVNSLKGMGITWSMFVDDRL